MHQSSNFLPPEWAPQSAVMLTWPHKDTIWAETLADIDKVFTQVTYEISLHEQVLITYCDAAHREHILKLLKNADVNLNQVKLYHALSDDIWVRDHGVIGILQNQKPKLLDFGFNGWGNKYPAENDNKLTQIIYNQGAFGTTPIDTINKILEGGSIEVDGQGTLLTTRSCLLALTRNPELNQQQLEEYLQQWFGVTRVLWLEHGGLAGDDTDSHIDTLARFTDPHTIAYIQCTDPNDDHYQTLKAMEDELRSFVDYQNNPYRLVPLPWPQARFADYDGRRLPVTYANFLIINNAVLVPTYDDPADADALEILATCFPDRKIIAIPSLAVVQWYGSLHCMTMQLPQGVI